MTNHAHTANVPHLDTAMTGPLHELEQHIIARQMEIEAWFRKQWQLSPAPIHSSVDLRNAGFKLAPVDTNLFPAGFNNLNPEMMALCIQGLQSAFETTFPGCDRVLIIPESHTRNISYFESLATLQEIYSKAGYAVRIGTLLDEIDAPKTFELPSDRSVTLEPLVRDGNRLMLEDFNPCVIVLNNDLSEGIPDILQNLEQHIRPPLDLGWVQRLKSGHFTHYNQVVDEFAKLIDIDPWFINPLFRNCGEIDFMLRDGEDCLVKHIEQLLEEIAAKYAKYNIEHQPYVIVKADAGTYGMGVMSITDAEQIKQLNRKQRSRMAASKGKQQVSQVLIQEGVHSLETWGEAQGVAEPVVYMLGHHVVGGFYRIHKQRGPQDNLNAPGMEFEPLAFASCCNNPDITQTAHESTNRFYAYGVVARLALLAAAQELKESLA